MTTADPYTIEGRYYPDPLKTATLVKREREGRTLACTVEPIRIFSRDQELVFHIPRGYVTDWASVPQLVQARFQPYGRHVWAALGHDYLYSVGEPGRKPKADALFLEKLEEAEVSPIRRTLMYRAVQMFGGPGYGRAAAEWATSFRDPDTGRLCQPPFAREQAFMGAEFGPQPWAPA